MACTVTLKQDAAVIATEDAAIYSKVAELTTRYKTGAQLRIRDGAGGVWTITYSGTSTCSTCSKTIPAPSTITVQAP